MLANLNNADPEAFANGIAAVVDPALAVPPLAPIPDLAPEATARFTTLLEQAREGTLDPAGFAYVPWYFFPYLALNYQRLLQSLGPAGPLVLVKREVVGDDRVYTYLVQFGTVTYRYSVSLIPDGRVSAFELREN